MLLRALRYIFTRRCPLKSCPCGIQDSRLVRLRYHKVIDCPKRAHHDLNHH